MRICPEDAASEQLSWWWWGSRGPKSENGLRFAVGEFHRRAACWASVYTYVIRRRKIERERERERIGRKARIWIAHREMNWEITRKKGRNMRNYRDKKRDMNMEKSYGEQYGLVNGRSLRLSKGIGKYPELNQPTWWVFLESSVANFILGVTPHVQGGTGIPKSIIPGWFLQKHRQVISHAKSDFQMFSFTTHSWNGPCHTFSPICVSWKSSFSTQKGRIWRI